jgi:hypothetical protein
MALMQITYEWRGDFTNEELNVLHAEPFETRVYSKSEWNWKKQARTQPRVAGCEGGFRDQSRFLAISPAPLRQLADD